MTIKSLKRWLKETLLPISTSIQDYEARHQENLVKAQQEAKRRHDREDQMLAEQKEYQRLNALEELRYAKQETIRALARQILVQREAQSTIRLSDVEADAALAAAGRIYAMTADFFVLKETK